MGEDGAVFERHKCIVLSDAVFHVGLDEEAIQSFGIENGDDTVSDVDSSRHEKSVRSQDTAIPDPRDLSDCSLSGFA